ncbi:MAG: YybH family protein [Actinomycetota bacterium]
MDTDALRSWVDRYRLVWESNDPVEIGALFTEDATYATEPYAEPWRGREQIVSRWLDAKDEPGQTEFRFEVMGIDGDLGFVRGWTRYHDPPAREYANLWVIRLEGDGRCSEFVEWYMKHRSKA